MPEARRGGGEGTRSAESGAFRRVGTAPSRVFVLARAMPRSSCSELLCLQPVFHVAGREQNRSRSAKQSEQNSKQVDISMGTH